jgi:hypothetical protein
MSKIYEIKDHEFEFYKDGKPTGHYARGIALKDGGTSLKMELLCNGVKVWVSKDKLILICDDNHTFGRKYHEPIYTPYLNKQ